MAKRTVPRHDDDDRGFAFIDLLTAGVKIVCWIVGGFAFAGVVLLIRNLF